MILYALPLACGNAVQLLFQPPAGAALWTVLRNTTGDFDGPDDPAATVCASGPLDLDLLDTAGLVNGTAYYYAVFWDGAQEAANRVSVTPAATYQADATDPQELLLERLDAGLQVEVARGTLIPAQGQTAIAVARAFALFEDARLPLVTVELAGCEVVGHAIGDTYTGEEGEECWQRRWTLAIVAWSLNPDERIALRQALERIVLANLPVLYHQGLREVALAWQDVFDDLQYGAPLYTAIGTLTCTALSAIVAPPAAPIGSVVVSVSP